MDPDDGTPRSGPVHDGLLLDPGPQGPIEDSQLYQVVREKVVQQLEAEHPEVLAAHVGDGWMDDMLTAFFKRLVDIVKEVFKPVTDSIEANFKALADGIVDDGFARLQPPPPIEFPGVLTLVNGAAGAAMEEEVGAVLAALLVEIIPFENLNAAKDIPEFVRDLSPNLLIIRQVSRVMIKKLVEEPLTEFYDYKYRFKRLTESQAATAFERKRITTVQYMDYLARQGYRDHDALEVVHQAREKIKVAVKKTKALTYAELSAAYVAGIITRQKLVQGLQVDGWETSAIETLTRLSDRAKVKAAAAGGVAQDDTALAIAAAKEIDSLEKELKHWGASDKQLNAFQSVVDKVHRRAVELIMKKYAGDVTGTAATIAQVATDAAVPVAKHLLPVPESLQFDSAAEFLNSRTLALEILGEDPSKLVPDRPAGVIRLSRTEASPAKAVSTSLKSAITGLTIDIGEGDPHVPIAVESINLLGDRLASALVLGLQGLRLPTPAAVPAPFGAPAAAPAPRAAPAPTGGAPAVITIGRGIPPPAPVTPPAPLAVGTPVRLATSRTEASQ